MGEVCSGCGIDQEVYQWLREKVTTDFATAEEYGADFKRFIEQRNEAKARAETAEAHLGEANEAKEEAKRHAEAFGELLETRNRDLEALTRQAQVTVERMRNQAEVGNVDSACASLLREYASSLEAGLSGRESADREDAAALMEPSSSRPESSELERAANVTVEKMRRLKPQRLANRWADDLQAATKRAVPGNEKEEI